MGKLYNGIELPEEWPPKDGHIYSYQPQQVKYLDNIPDVIPIDGGRQLFVDEYLIYKTLMTRCFHQPEKYSNNPILFPQTKYEYNQELLPCTVYKAGGVWYDEKDNYFKMWYMASYLGYMAFARSKDGLRWERPKLDVVEDTNLLLPMDIHPDSGTVWIDKDTDNESERYKLLIREPNMPEKGKDFGALAFTSEDGIHWNKIGESGPMGDRSTMFYNPFRKNGFKGSEGLKTTDAFDSILKQIPFKIVSVGEKMNRCLGRAPIVWTNQVLCFRNYIVFMQCLMRVL